MRSIKTLFVVGTLLLTCPAVALAQDAEEKTFTLADMLTDLASKPDVLDQILAQLGQHPTAVGLITPEAKAKLRAVAMQGDRDKLDAFLATWPSPTLKDMALSVDVIEKARKEQEGPQQDLGGPVQQQKPAAVRERLGIPTGGKALTNKEIRKELGHDVVYGESIDPERAKRFPDSKRLSDVLNKLSLNNAKKPHYTSVLLTARGVKDVTSVRALLTQLEKTGHSIEVSDARYIANFAGLRYQDKDVAVPFWIDTEVKVPGKDRNLLVPAGHAQHELIIRGPRVNADLKFFFGMHGEAKFRPWGTSRPKWTGSRVAHTYKGKDAVRAMSIAGMVRKAYVEKKRDNPDLPLNGYHELGVCNDSHAFIEYAMTGKTTVYPLTRDPKYFKGKGLIDRISRKMPIDGRGETSADLVDRVLASIPADNPDDLVFERLKNDVKAVAAAQVKDKTQQAKPGVQSDGALGKLKELPKLPEPGAKKSADKSSQKQKRGQKDQKQP